MSSEECPGATRCPLGEPCFAEVARRRAQAADLVVVNTHLYGLHLAGGEALLPEHDVVIFDEAHQLEDVISATAGLSLGAGRFSALARTRPGRAHHRRAPTARHAGEALAAALQPRLGQRLPDPLPAAVVDALVLGRGRVDEVQAGLRAIDTDVGEANQRKVRAQKAATTLTEHLDQSLAVRPGFVAFVAGTDRGAPPRGGADRGRPGAGSAVGRSARRCSPAPPSPSACPSGSACPPTAPTCSTWAARSTTASTPSSTARPTCPTRATRPSPRQSHLELGAHRRGRRAHAGAVHQLAGHAGRRRALRPKLAYTVLTQSDLPKPELLAAFAREESSCLFATAGLFQGIDVPGPSLSLVTIDRLPFPRPDDPLLQARREVAGDASFNLIDLPRATTLLAQAAVGSSAAPPTAAWSPSSTRAWPRPATAGTSCGPCPRCGAPAIARRPRRSCGRSPRNEERTRY